MLDVLDRGQYELLRTLGAAGAVVGSVAPALAAELQARRSERDGSDAGAELAIVATEGIGAARLCQDARALLAARQGGLACLSTGDAGDPRARPEVILPITTAQRGARSATSPGGRRARARGRRRVVTGRLPPSRRRRSGSRPGWSRGRPRSRWTTAIGSAPPIANLELIA